MKFADAMARARSLLPFCEGSRTYVTIGVFDGVHRGHQQLVTEMVEAAYSNHDLAIVVIIAPHPMATLGSTPPPLLTTVGERAELLAALGPDAIVTLPFTPATACVEAADFVEMLMHYFHLSALWGGPDLALGYRREGDISFLRRLGAERGFTVQAVEPLSWEGDLVSSSRVRAALQSGDIDQATGCLGRPYRLAGIATPSSLESYYCSPSPGRLIPTGGVYACLAHTEHRGAHPAMVSIAALPILAGREIPSNRQELAIEAYLPDLDVDLRNQMLALDFVARLRDKRAFPALNVLVAQGCEGIAQVQDTFMTGRT
jgi:riboflavin kinase/FMN adenylyltransferase